MTARKDDKPVRVCPACLPTDDCRDHKHWLVATPNAKHIDGCSKKETEPEPGTGGRRVRRKPHV